MNTKQFHTYNEDNEYTGVIKAYESPLEPGVYLNPPKSTELIPIGNENIFDGTKWVYMEKYVGTYYNTETKASVEVNGYTLESGLTSIAPKQFEYWIDGAWVRNDVEYKENAKAILYNSCMGYQKEIARPRIDSNFFGAITSMILAKVMNPALVIPKTEANKLWLDTLWTDYEIRKVSIDTGNEIPLTFENNGNPPYSYDECVAETGS